ncbi:hypothetical protein BT96DRAFT_766602, partial [Gymnopus androsaceus JB14]
NTSKECTMGKHGTKMQHQQGGANEENVTAIVAICSNGTTLCLTVIFKGNNM